MNRIEPLTAEERELARLLGRATPVAPPAALDDAVLAAARAAVQAPPAASIVPAAAVASGKRSARPRSRLPAALGLAASVVFAVGIAWQLKPEPPQVPALEATAPAPTTAPSPAPAVETAEDVDAADRAPAAARARPQAAQAPVAEALPAPAPVAAPVAPPAAAPLARQAPPRPAPLPAPMAAPPAPVQADAMDSMAAPAHDQVELTAAQAAADTARLKHAEAAPAASGQAARTASTMRRAEASVAPQGMLSSHAVEAAVAADAALPRKQWLKRIRERRDAGDVDTARASLERYLQHHPEVRVPHDLRQLLDN
ncbi:hypothetical protein [Stenotrophomonas rhizophila]|uniref:hypothetical protein n=1 Tax=Stenotrophomonas rhizophila TaxID=216778 RepID=UPI001E63D53F|nr:hypothetical protein [Stenotrophomonas rhizophila]MCC7633591.1 hypothetical protein [Stenotrophomonas rhizophila]MCC7662924.1 hypothetical protein [Stenotrophomonas rhizophila]